MGKTRKSVSQLKNESEFNVEKLWLKNFNKRHGIGGSNVVLFLSIKNAAHKLTNVKEMKETHWENLHFSFNKMNFGGYENPNKRAETGFENVQNQKSISYELSFHRYDISAISLVGSIAVCPVFLIFVRKFCKPEINLSCSWRFWSVHWSLCKRLSFRGSFPTEGCLDVVDCRKWLSLNSSRCQNHKDG